MSGVAQKSGLFLCCEERMAHRVSLSDVFPQQHELLSVSSILTDMHSGEITAVGTS
jgi:hypothetical protein